MAREYGRVKSSLWHDYKAIGLSHTAKLVAVWLLTCEEANPDLNAGRIALRLGLSAAAGQAALEELQRARLLSLVDGNVYLDGLRGYGRLATTQGRRPPLALWQRLRALVFARDNFTCRYCGSANETLECDHITPVARGGDHDQANLATACHRCNRSKGAKTVEEWTGAA